MSRLTGDTGEPLHDEIGTLEWSLPCPPPAHTFETLPTREMWDKQPGH